MSEPYGGFATHSLELRIPPIVIFGIFALCMWLIAVYFPVFDVHIPFRLTLTIFLMAAAIYTGIYSLYLFYKAKTTVHPHKPDNSTALLTTGPYKHTRNPMYLALSLILIGWGIFLTDLLALMLMPAFYAYITRFQIIPEERELIRLFDEEFMEYASKTPRWL